jgi:hypothetical protein
MIARTYLTAVLAFVALPLWSQVESSGAQPAGEEAPMFSPVSDEGYSLAFASETPRTNVLRGGLNVGSSYDDNLSSGIRDVRYSIWPSISLDQSRSRFSWDLTYTPGFMFYQRNSSIDESDHNLALGFASRLSPHVTLVVRDSFQKTSDFVNLYEQSASASGSGVVQGLNGSIVPPTGTARISSFSDAALTYQFSETALVGAKGTFSGLWYPDRAKLPGLFDSTSQGGEAFYTHRLSLKHYVGVTYEFQRLLTHPSPVETQTQTTLVFYTLYLPPSLIVSVFAGPERSDTHGGTAIPLRTWSPAAGASLGWHGARASIVASGARRISDGGGLSTAVRSSNGYISVRWQLAKNWTAGFGGNYSASSVLDALPSSSARGHTVSGSVSVLHPLRDRLAIQMGYTRLHQSYSSVEAISNAPDRNNVWVSLSYQFERPFGR